MTHRSTQIRRRALRAFAAAAVGLAAAGSAQAALLVYEPFNYTTGTPSGSGVLLNGQSGGLGMTGSWATTNNGTANSVTVYPQGTLSGVNLSTGAANIFDGTYTNLPHSGGYFGSVGLGGTANTTDHIYASRGLDPSVTATFTEGATTWFSLVTARAFNANATSPRFAIGAGPLLPDRGHLAAGEAIGVGGGLQVNTLEIFPQFWDDTQTAGTFHNHNVAGIQVGTGAATTNQIPAGLFFPWATTEQPSGAQSVPNIILGKITWSNVQPDVISIAAFLESDALTESNFNAIAVSSAGWTLGANLDQSQFDTISLAGGRYFADEIRIGTSFADIIAPGSTPGGGGGGGGGTGAATPEPASLSLVGLGVLALARRRRQAR